MTLFARLNLLKIFEVIFICKVAQAFATIFEDTKMVEK
jgi:hypothetical protein